MAHEHAQKPLYTSGVLDENEW